jgi:hypothetical protein
LALRLKECQQRSTWAPSCQARQHIRTNLGRELHDLSLSALFCSADGQSTEVTLNGEALLIMKEAGMIGIVEGTAAVRRAT